MLPWILYGLLLALYFVTLPAIFKKAGVNSKHGFIPILQWVTWLKVLGRPWWWVILLIVPGVNLIMHTIMHIETAIVFGQRSTKEQWFAGVLPWVYLPKLAFKDPVAYVGARDWKGKKKGMAREWGEAIVFAVVAASIIRTFFLEAFTIPTPSMEGSMLTGDYLFVSKMSYGPKVPQTPMSIPFMHNAFPGSLTPSYLEWFSLPYMRLPGFGDVERLDPVVFNFPHGDTVMVHAELVGFDYYQYLKKEAILEAGKSYETYLTNPEKYMAKARSNFDNGQCKVYKAERGGRVSDRIEGIKVRPVDKMENYVKRCVGIAGDDLEIRDRQIFINGEAQDNPEMLQYNYRFKALYSHVDKLVEKLAFSASEVSPRLIEVAKAIQERQLNSGQAIDWMIPLTAGEAKKLENNKFITEMEMVRYPSNPGLMFPYSDDPAFGHWTLDDFGPVHIPAAGESIELTAENVELYERTITAYEGHTLKKQGDQVLIDGVVATSFTFTQNYYWMMGDNRHNSLDSRYWGFVPETHVVGKPVFTWFSKENEQFHGQGRSGVRWDRMFRLVD